VPALIGIAGVTWSTWLLGGHDLEIAFGAGLRVLALVLPSVVLLPYVDPDALGDHLAQRLRLPARPVVAATAALQRFQTFGSLWTELTRARRVRGVGAGRSLVAKLREGGATTLALFTVILGQAAVLALAMDARGFAGAHRRTWAGPAPWRLPDTLVLLGALLVLVTAVVARLLVT
jgi:energy-coupling factor transport system ATP-binding protein